MFWNLFLYEVPAVFRIRIHRLKNWKKFTVEKKFNLKKIILQFTFPQASKRTSKLQKKPSALRRGHPAVQNMKFLKFFIFFCLFFLLAGRIQIPIPDPDSESGSRYRIWIKIRIHWSDSIRIRIQSGSKTPGSVPGFRIRNFFTDLDPGGQLIMDPAGSGPTWMFLWPLKQLCTSKSFTFFDSTFMIN